MREVLFDAAWRRPDQFLTHEEFVSDVQAKGRWGDVYNFVRLTQDCVRTDWLHCMDLGVTIVLFSDISRFSMIAI